MVVWEGFTASLFVSPLVETISYTPEGQAARDVLALIGPRDVSTDVGSYGAQQDVLMIEVRQADLPWRPRARRDTFTRFGVTYRVSSNAAPGIQALTWVFSAYAE
ncbi:MAG: hypothetical protein K0R61_2372 [Microvirga sp.]|jgi:hypothetical protein|nr:hypothetical protein [Microvirga sp.]MDF2971922.1 hypothetical protein [Microvirga sp.]